MPVTLVTGPVRSGKSRRATSIAQASGRRVSYIAMSVRDANDSEWEARVQRHVRERPSTWETVETAEFSRGALLALFREAVPDQCLIVESLGTWLAGRIARDLDAFAADATAFETRMDDEATELARAMLESRALVVVVAEEVGWDVVPTAASARLFRDVVGRMKQQLAHGADDVLLIVCGVAIDLRALSSTKT
jgi:adenosylcobinamide kinase / adenosylcobinamide-phosphate guanylyltransferase